MLHECLLMSHRSCLVGQLHRSLSHNNHMIFVSALETHDTVDALSFLLSFFLLIFAIFRPERTPNDHVPLRL